MVYSELKRDLATITPATDEGAIQIKRLDQRSGIVGDEAIAEFTRRIR
jgi:hypothetical protein